MTTIRLDETHCPSGLERTMYDLAFKLRADRHALEQSLLEQQKSIEVKRLEVIELYKQMKYHEEVYDKEKETLLTFRVKIENVYIDFYEKGSILILLNSSNSASDNKN